MLPKMTWSRPAGSKSVRASSSRDHDPPELLGGDVLQLGAGPRVRSAQAVDDDDLTRHATFRPPAYIPSISSWYRVSRMRRLTLSVGVIEPSSIVRSAGRRAKARICSWCGLSGVVGVDLPLEEARGPPGSRRSLAPTSDRACSRPPSPFRRSKLGTMSAARNFCRSPSDDRQADERRLLELVLDRLRRGLLAAREHDQVLLAVRDREEAVGDPVRRCRPCGTSRPRRSPRPSPRAC